MTGARTYARLRTGPPVQQWDLGGVVVTLVFSREPTPEEIDAMHEYVNIARKAAAKRAPQIADVPMEGT